MPLPWGPGGHGLEEGGRKTGCVARNALMLCEIGQILARHGVIWWAMYGSLLGVMREKSVLKQLSVAGLLPDDDHDIGVWLGDYTRYFTPKSPRPNPVVRDLESAGYVLHDWGKISPARGGVAGCASLEVETWPMCYNPLDGKRRAGTIPRQGVEGREPIEGLDDTVRGGEEPVYYCDCEAMHYHRDHFIAKHTTQRGSFQARLEVKKVDGTLVPVPTNSTDLLTAIYGDWRMPGPMRANEGKGCERR